MSRNADTPTLSKTVEHINSLQSTSPTNDDTIFNFSVYDGLAVSLAACLFRWLSDYHLKICPYSRYQQDIIELGRNYLTVIRRMPVNARDFFLASRWTRPRVTTMKLHDTTHRYAAVVELGRLKLWIRRVWYRMPRQSIFLCLLRGREYCQGAILHIRKNIVSTRCCTSDDAGIPISSYRYPGQHRWNTSRLSNAFQSWIWHSHEDPRVHSNKAPLALRWTCGLLALKAFIHTHLSLRPQPPYSTHLVRIDVDP